MKLLESQDLTHFFPFYNNQLQILKKKEEKIKSLIPQTKELQKQITEYERINNGGED